MAANDANAPVPSSGPVPFKDIGNDTVPEHNPKEELSDLVAALPHRRDQLMDVRLYQGCWLPEFWVPGIVELQRRFNPRPDDVIIASYPKSGTTWLMALAFATMARGVHPPAGAGHPLRRLNPHDCIPFIDQLFACGDQTKLDLLPSPRLMCTHLPYALLPESVTAGGCRVVYICRDPKDMFVSMWHFIQRSKPDSSFTELFNTICDGTVTFGPVWEHVLSYWRASVSRPDRVLFLKYEDLLRDSGKNIRRLAEFLCRPFSATEEAAGDVATIMELCSLNRMKGLEENKAGSLRVGNGVTISYDALFRKGVVGDWANLMTPEMVARLDGIFRKKLAGTGFAFA